jgi:hypothetical protein
MVCWAPRPWVLAWDANGELAIQDRYDLLMHQPSIDRTCSLGVNPLAEGNGGWLRACSSPGQGPRIRPHEGVEPSKNR